MKFERFTAGISAAAYFALLAAPVGAATTIASATVDSTTQADTHSDGSSSSASVNVNGSARATAALDAVHIIGADTTHFSAGAPSSSARSVFSFAVLGATGPVALDFNFVPTGQWNFGSGAYAVNGGFTASLDSFTAASPLKTGSFVSVQFDSRIDQGSVRTTSDRFTAPLTSVSWLGEPISPFTLSSSFLAGPGNSGQLTLEAIGGYGNSNGDFSLALASIRSASGLQGLTVVADNGRIFNVDAISAVPEPETWAMMLVGFGAIGVAIRRRSKVRIKASFA